MARNHVTVALSGDGGDELFGGYSRYLVDRRRSWVDLLPLRLRRATFGQLADRLSPDAYGVNFIRGLACARPERYLNSITTTLNPASGGIASSELFDAVSWDQIAEPFLQAFERAQGRDFSSRLMYVDLKTYLPDDVLTKVDRMSMAHSLEVRVPLLDHRVAEFAVSLPASYKIRRHRTKRILLEAMGHRLPEPIYRRPKQGFALPLAPWFKAGLRDWVNRVPGLSGELGHILNPMAVERLVQEHLVGRRDHGTALWKLIVLIEWERWIRSQVRPSGS
jgi:asparagine synthase (glutamine-hydrolysing)